MYHVSARGIDERMINVHYYYYYYDHAQKWIKALEQQLTKVVALLPYSTGKHGSDCMLTKTAYLCICFYTVKETQLGLHVDQSPK